MDILQQIKEYATEAGSPEIYADLQADLAALGGRGLCLGVLGGDNSGKSSLINALTGSKLPTSPRPSHTDATESFAGATVLELHPDIVDGHSTPLDIYRVASKFDACIYMLDAQAALSRSDMLALETLEEVGIPTFAVVSRLDLIDDSDGDREELLNYIGKQLWPMRHVFLSAVGGHVARCADTIRSEAEDLLAKATPEVNRRNFRMLYIMVAIGRLFEACQEKLDKAGPKVKAAKEAFADKKSKLDDKDLEWGTLETDMRARMLAISDKLRKLLDDNKDDMVRRLVHDAELTPDVKLFWDKDLPFRLEELMRAEATTATQLVAREAERVAQWLRSEMMLRFRRQIPVETTVEGVRPGAASTAGGPGVTDVQRLRIMTRVGSTAATIGIGALFMLTGVGGILIGVSMATGIGAEFFMKKKITEAREQVKKAIPQVVERNNLRIVAEFRKMLTDLADDLAEQLDRSRREWYDDACRALEKEQEIAIFNTGAPRFRILAEHVNELAESIM